MTTTLRLYNQLHHYEKWLFDSLSIILLIFYSASAIIEPAATQYHRGLFVMLSYVMVLLIYRSGDKRGYRILDYTLIVLSIYSLGYWILNFEAINYRTGAETMLDQYTAIVGVLIGIEIARRVVGQIFVILSVILLLYGVYGDASWIPEDIQHAGDTFLGLCTSIFYKSDGVFGIMANVLASYIFLFIIFGAFLESSGAQRFFIDFPMAAVGHRVGGPAKVAVIASGLFGSISGSAIANTVSTGAFTIPLMKRAGFKPHVAGAIEPAASIGGMFLPPIMGAGGFIMSELTGLPYSQIILVAAFPAIMYMFSVYLMVHFNAKQEHMVQQSTTENHTSAWDILRKEWHYICPLVVLSALLLSGYSPAYSAIFGILACIAVSFVKSSRKEERITLKRFIEASRQGNLNCLQISATLGVIGIIIGVLTYSGLMLTFADIVIDLADGKLWLTIIFIALASLVLGMGVPVTASYLIIAVIAVPTLTELGVNLLAAHMIVYWLSQDSNITPPVCIAAFAGATIAKANMWKTAITAFKFAKFLYLAPFLFGYVPGFTLNGSALDIGITFILIIIGTYLFTGLLSGIWFKQVWNALSSPRNL